MKLYDRLNEEKRKQLEEFKQEYPTLGEKVILSLKRESSIMQLTIDEWLDIRSCFKLNYELMTLIDFFKEENNK